MASIPDRAFWTSILFILLYVAPLGSANSFIFPSEGTVISAGSIVDIQWTNLHGSLVSIRLRQADPGDVPIVRAVAQDVANTGSFTWMIDNVTPEATYFFEISMGDGSLATDSTFGPAFFVSSNIKLTSIRPRDAVATTAADSTAVPTASASESSSIQSSASSSSPTAGGGRIAIIVITVLVAMILAAGAILLLQHLCSKRRFGYKPIGIDGVSKSYSLTERVKTNLRSYKKEVKLVNPAKPLKSVHFRMSEMGREKILAEKPSPYQILRAPSGRRYQKMPLSIFQASKMPPAAPNLMKELPPPPDYSMDIG